MPFYIVFFHPFPELPAGGALLLTALPQTPKDPQVPSIFQTSLHVADDAEVLPLTYGHRKLFSCILHCTHKQQSSMSHMKVTGDVYDYL